MAQVDGSGGAFAPHHRPAHLQWRYLGLVAVGGAVGTALRVAITMFVPDTEPFPVPVFAVNLVGALALGLLLEALARSGPDEGRRLGARLLVGTGVLGGFTTFSALATATAQLAIGDAPWWAAAYALGTVLLGAALSVAGIAVGRRVGRRSAGAS
jgi:CrcB protein